jgi:Carboxypeptidase regulatory-like domain/TonB-dependent Receptor Plug Domain
MKSQRQSYTLLLVCALVLLFAAAAFAQETTAGIQGTVKDQSGAMVAKATVEVSGPALIGTKKLETDASGVYRFAQLPPGEYTLTVTAQGFRPIKRAGLDLQVGRMPTVDLQLQVGTAAETVEVTGEAPLVDVTSSKVATAVNQTMLENIPTGRSYQSVIPFAPGARQEPLQSSRNGTRTTGFQIDGASDSENVYLIDGMNTTNLRDGGVVNNFQMDFVQEVQIKSSSFEAEFGGALGGVVNAVPKHGSNAWHGEIKTYLRSNALNANDSCNVPASPGLVQLGVTCFVRANATPANGPTSLGTAQKALGPRADIPTEFYVPQKDEHRSIEPGFEIGGPIRGDKLWFYTSYIPTIDTLRRTVNFTGANAGTRTFTQSFTQHNSYTRLDYAPLQSLRLFAGWNYAYSRLTGSLPSPDSAIAGQVNTGASTDPSTLRPDNGLVNPSSIYNFGGDWTPNSKTVVSARWGYQFYNSEDRGKPSGVRYILQNTVKSTDTGLDGQPIGFSNTAGFANIGSNLQTLFDAWKRRSLNLDASYYVGHFFGSHNFKGGYMRMAQQNDVLSTFNTAQVLVFHSDKYVPVTSTTACDGVISQNVTRFGAAAAAAGCRGNDGYFIVRDGVTNTGLAKGLAQAIYFQDGWNAGHGLTLNLGVRFDNEFVPPYRAGFRSVDFGWKDKIAPRIGGAYDLLHNGKVKVYASYGKFFDIMKLGLPRGSFGSDYWHDCVYAMDNGDPNNITVAPTNGHGCPSSGPATGIAGNVGRFIENVDFRNTKDDPRDPPLDPNIKPMLQHEYVGGVDWMISPNWSLETRYSRKRLDRTIEDMSITDNLGFYIGNPGSSFTDLLHRSTVIDGQAIPALCPECPTTNVPATRRYDGVEFRLSRKTGQRWWGSVSYTYSKLTGNYAGLTNTDISDGNGGRHAPNNNRAFDLPTMLYDTTGKLADGPLATDRPHTAKVYGYYRLPWLGQETTIGFQQYAFEGTPLSTCVPVVGTSSACQFFEGRGNFLQVHRDAATGNLVQDGVVRGARTEPYFQTDMNFQHAIKPSKTHEGQRITFQAELFNLFNQHAVLSQQEILFQGSGLLSPSRPARFAGDPGVDWNAVMRGYNPLALANSAGLLLNGRYGQPQLYQNARNMRLAIRYTF